MVPFDADPVLDSAGALALDRLAVVGAVLLTGGDRRPAERVPVAVGREPVTDTTNLGAPGPEPGGAIAVDEACRTAAEGVFAVGDATDDPMLAHRAVREGVVADAETETVPGAQVVGRDASGLVAEVTPAVETGATLADVAATVHVRRTLSEAVHEAPRRGDPHPQPLTTSRGPPSPGFGRPKRPKTGGRGGEKSKV